MTSLALVVGNHREGFAGLVVDVELDLVHVDVDQCAGAEADAWLPAGWVTPWPESGRCTRSAVVTRRLLAEFVRRPQPADAADRLGVLTERNAMSCSASAEDSLREGGTGRRQPS
ncbi:MAG TPA: hypothetical protein VNT22_11645 [Baekduia sp.]|nr:hypothetical protein [Baekduia sp.]